jgi:hypothetical protein
MHSLKSLAMNCGQLSEMIRGFACAYAKPSPEATDPDSPPPPGRRFRYTSW